MPNVPPAHGDRVAVSLLSSAFVLGASAAAAAGVSVADAVQQRACSSLGVAPGELSFFELREIKGPADWPAGPSNIAVLPTGSGA